MNNLVVLPRSPHAFSSIEARRKESYWFMNNITRQPRARRYRNTGAVKAGSRYRMGQWP